jgi:hypothetical protein
MQSASELIQINYYRAGRWTTDTLTHIHGHRSPEHESNLNAKTPKLACLAASCAVAFSSAASNSFKIMELRTGTSVAKHLSTTINEEHFPISHPAPDLWGNFSPSRDLFAGRACQATPDRENLHPGNAAFGRFFAGFQF